MEDWFDWTLAAPAEKAEKKDEVKVEGKGEVKAEIKIEVTESACACSKALSSYYSVRKYRYSSF